MQLVEFSKFKVKENISYEYVTFINQVASIVDYNIEKYLIDIYNTRKLGGSSGYGARYNGNVIGFSYLKYFNHNDIFAEFTQSYDITLLDMQSSIPIDDLNIIFDDINNTPCVIYCDRNFCKTLVKLITNLHIFK